jgi:hypothetical protein
MAFLTALAIIAACAWFNRMAGGGWPSNAERWYDFLTSRWACAVYLGLAAWTMHAWPVAIAFGGGFLFWRIFSWGYLIGGIAGGHRPTGRDPRPVEGTLLKWFGPYGGMFARMMFVLPCLIAVAWLAGALWIILLAIPFAAIATLSYVLAWRYTPRHVIENAEWAVGVLWGALIVLT